MRRKLTSIASAIRFRRRNLSFAASLLALSLPLCAQPGLYTRVPSVDTIVARADQVIVGRIVELGGAPPDVAVARLPPVVLAVEETLKGPDVQRLQLNLDFGYRFGCKSCSARQLTLPILAEWKASSHRLFVAVSHDADSPVVIDLDADGLELWSADWVLLNRAADVMQDAKQQAHRTPTAVNQNPACALPAGSSIQVIVPADQRLEQRAQAIIEKKQPGFRDQAVIAMQCFRSANNIHLVTSLLNDPELDVRHAAYQVLKSWGMDAGTRDPLHW